VLNKSSGDLLVSTKLAREDMTAIVAREDMTAIQNN
jgi:hypothetical protein